MTSLMDLKYEVDFKLHLKRIIGVISHQRSPDKTLKQNLQNRLL